MKFGRRGFLRGAAGLVAALYLPRWTPTAVVAPVPVTAAESVPVLLHSASILADGNWHHIAVVVADYYIDGQICDGSGFARPRATDSWGQKNTANDVRTHYSDVFMDSLTVTPRRPVAPRLYDRNPPGDYQMFTRTVTEQL